MIEKMRAIEFLESSMDTRLVQLENLGLLRYAKLLTQMGTSDGNIACISNFFAQPQRLKFPQLMGTDLQGLDLSCVNFIRANLTGANLTGCCLQDAELIFGNFQGANLRDADLRGATVNETIWVNSIVNNTDFRGAIGLTSIQMRELKARGGIFEE